jgi:hypothetical protein
VLRAYYVSVTCSRGREGRWSWRLTHESGARPRAGCPEHVGDITEDMRGAYMVMEFELPYPRASSVEWRSFVCRLDKESVGMVVEIAEAFRCAEATADCGQSMVESTLFLYVCLWGRVRDGWFSSRSSCKCDGSRLFVADASMCLSCVNVPLLSRRVVAQSAFAGVLPYGRKHWWKGVTDAASAWPKWRRARWCIVRFGETSVCNDCVKAFQQCMAFSSDEVR